MNKGMGHKFLKHVERTKQLLFVVSEDHKTVLGDDDYNDGGG